MNRLNRDVIYRNEWKYYISLQEAELLKRRIAPFMERDPYTSDGKYMIRSLYFDDYWNSAYEEKIMGAEDRKKWRVRIYNLRDSRIRLERKRKWGSYIYKESAGLTREELEKILDGNYEFLFYKESELCRQFYYECMVNLHRPKVIVDYEREPFVRQEGNVRITFDSDVRASAGDFQIFDSQLPVFSVLPPGIVILEVKFTEFLPGVIKELLPLDGQEFSAISKYTLCYEKVYYMTDVLAGISKTNRREKENESKRLF